MVKGKSSKSKVLLELFVKISENEAYWDKWRTTEQWLELISATYPECHFFGFVARDFNRNLSIDPDTNSALCITARQQTHMVSMLSSIEKMDSKQQQFTAANHQLVYEGPPQMIVGFRILFCSAFCQNKTKSNKKDYNDKVAAMLSLEGKKRKLTHNAAPDFGNNEIPSSHVPTDDGSPTTKLSDTIKEESYWDSPESKYLFQPEENKKGTKCIISLHVSIKGSHHNT